MAALHFGTTLSTEERAEKQRLIVRDAIALLSLFAITAVLFTLTLLLFRSFSQHRQKLGERWRMRGETALNSGHPENAIEALRSALAYAPSNRGLQIELAEALAASGRTQEALAYFNTLLESEPGNGMINLQLARLAARQGSTNVALEHYESAMDGTWQGDGYVRRREVRLEMARYLIGLKRYDEARSQLLVAAGNAPDDVAVKLQIADLLEQAQYPADALVLYRGMLTRHHVRLAALQGAARTAFELGRFIEARSYLERAITNPDFAKEAESSRDANREMLADCTRILELYPLPSLRVKERATRISYNAKTAFARLTSCLAQNNTSAPLQGLATQWQQTPATSTINALERDPQLEQTMMQLVYETEKVTSQSCGAPTGDDALLLKIAQAPDLVAAGPGMLGPQ
ncbi:tetratricopeptide repeat protein [Acidipila rosea]|uniref:Tetratricopeptide repeat protein n=1 Tax=Acidipila rosea TaxID=768535 RepID=A0A4R1LBI0_9BACT|nr:tetratricopeptide repeat protein [Acidipila rosea]TCK75722.1 tetratricopeptide repeat protein [Acidipila rosea]